MHIHDTTTNISIKVEALANNKLLAEYFTSQEGHTVTCTIPVNSKDQITLKGSYIAEKKATLDWDYYIDGICRFSMFSQSDAKAWKALNKELQYCYDAKPGDKYVTDCKMIVEPLTVRLEADGDVDIVPGIGEIRVLVYRRGPWDIPHTRPSMTDTECWKPTLPAGKNAHLAPTHFISLVAKPENVKNYAVNTIRRHLEYRDPDGPLIQLIFQYRDSRKVADLANLIPGSNPTEIDFAFASTPKPYLIKQERASTDGLDETSADLSIISDVSQPLTIIDDETAGHANLQSPIESQARKRNVGETSPLSAALDVNVKRFQADGAIIGTARQRYEDRMRAEARRKEERDNDLQMLMNDVNENIQKEQDLLEKLEDYYKQLDTKFQAEVTAKEAEYTLAATRLKEQSKYVKENLANLEREMSSLEKQLTEPSLPSSNTP